MLHPIAHAPTLLLAQSTMGMKFTGGPGLGFGLGGVVMVDPVLAGSLHSKGTWGWAGAATTMFFYDPVEDMAMIMFSQKFMAWGDSKYVFTCSPPPPSLPHTRVHAEMTNK